MNVSSDLVHDCARFILNKSSCKVPIKKTEICKYLHNAQSGLSNAGASTVIEKAKEVLEDVYGIKLQKITSKGGKSYILVLSEEISDEYNFHKQEHHNLLIGTLGHIFMSGGAVREEEMWIFLEKANLIEPRDSDKRKILTHKFTRELYLQYEKLDESEYGGFIFKWGERALLELPQMYLLEKIAKAFERTPEYWHEQHETAKNQQRIVPDETQQSQTQDS